MASKSKAHLVIGRPHATLNYKERVAVRLLIFNSNMEFALLHATNRGYYKLPGGGIEAIETPNHAGKREALEELGAKVWIHDDHFATAEEWRGDLHQVSICYYARLLELTKETALEKDEIEDGLVSQWVKVNAAIELIKNNSKSDEELGIVGKSIKERDLFFIEECSKEDHFESLVMLNMLDVEKLKGEFDIDAQ